MAAEKKLLAAEKRKAKKAADRAKSNAEKKTKSNSEKKAKSNAPKSKSKSPSEKTKLKPKAKLNATKKKKKKAKKKKRVGTQFATKDRYPRKENIALKTMRKLGLCPPSAQVCSQYVQYAGFDERYARLHKKMLAS